MRSSAEEPCGEETACLDGERCEFVHAANHVAYGIDVGDVCLFVDYRDVTSERERT